MAGRPDSTDRCLAAVDTYRREQTEANRAALREAYLAIPQHLRLYALGDMDAKDRPLRTLAFDDDEESRQRALAYFADREQTREARPEPADGPERSALSTVTIHGTVYPGGWPSDPGLEVQNSYPAPITVAGHTYPTVTHAYWPSARPTNSTAPASRRPTPLTRQGNWPSRPHDAMAGPTPAWRS